MYRPNEISASAPTVNDDFSAGFKAGNGWLNTTDGSYYICQDDTVGAAVWTEVSASSTVGVWDDWTPTIAFSPATPTAPTYVARYIQIGNIVYFYFDITGSNDSGSVIDYISITPPVTIKDTNAYPSFSVASNPSGTTVPTTIQFGLIDAESSSSRKLYAIDLKVANTSDYRVTGEGFYEVT